MKPRLLLGKIVGRKELSLNYLVSLLTWSRCLPGLAAVLTASRLGN